MHRYNQTERDTPKAMAFMLSITEKSGLQTGALKGVLGFKDFKHSESKQNLLIAEGPQGEFYGLN